MPHKPCAHKPAVERNNEHNLRNAHAYHKNIEGQLLADKRFLRKDIGRRGRNKDNKCAGQRAAEYTVDKVTPHVIVLPHIGIVFKMDTAVKKRP